jgi:uncharacterized membrane protein (UPF0182 family)
MKTNPLKERMLTENSAGIGIFGIDLSFYRFRVPWYELLQGGGVLITVLAITAAGAQYVQSGLLKLLGRRILNRDYETELHRRYHRQIYWADELSAK